MAGLAPELRAHGEWLVIAVRPGRDPFSSLSYAVSETMDARQSAPSWAKNPFEVLEAMKRQPLVEVLSQLLRVSGCGRLLLIADQFEELFTLCRDAKVRDRWLEELIGVGSDLGGGVQALVSMRSDYERRGKAQARSMETILNWPRVTLPVMSDEEIRGVIERPAIRLGVTFEPGLVEQILTEFCDHPGGLPMLQFMLTLLWERQVNRELTLSDYRTLGGVAGALAKYADDVFDRLSEDEQRQARRVLLQLVGLVEVAAPDGATDARRPLLEHEVRDGDWDMIRHLSQERLLYLDQAESGEEVAELTHESLAWSWPRLEEWIAEADKALRASDQIADRVAMRFSIGAGAANLLPPPADMIAVGTTFAMMGRQIAKAYDLRVDREILRTAGISMAQGIAAASGAAYGGTQLVKAFPGMSVWVGLLIQPPLVAAIAYAVAATWKFYFHVVSAGGRGPDNAELREFVITMFRNKLGEVDPVAMPTRFGKWRGRSKKAHHT
ncbi:MAG: hypothetical protein WCG47_15730 [Dermatophilaceae bacterium]